MKRLALALMVALLLSGCSGARHAGAAAIQAQQAVQATAKVAAGHDVQAALASLDEQQRQVVLRALQTIVDLSVQASDSLEPVIRRLGAIEPPAAVATSVDQAIERPQEFIRAATKQAGLAEAEAEQAEQAARFRVSLADYGAEVGSSLLSGGLIGGGLGGLLLAGAGVALRARKTFTTVKTAVEDAVAAGVDLAKASTPEQVQAVKEEHAKRQEVNGTRGVIKPLVSQAKLRARARDAAAT